MSMNKEEYLTVLKDQIRDKHAKEFVSTEIRDHIEDQAEGYINDGMDSEQAVIKAVEEMGDPVTVGAGLDRIHRPHMEWGFLIYVLFISVLSIAVQYSVIKSLEPGFERTFGIHVGQVLIGLVVMMVVYRTDYTVLLGRSRLIGIAFLVLVTVLTGLFGYRVNGANMWIRFGSATASNHALMVLFLPIFAGILYEYRGKKAAVPKIILWMILPVLCEFFWGFLSLPFIAFILLSEGVLFILALRKGWYNVNLTYLIAGFGTVFAIIIAFAGFSVWKRGTYQNSRFRVWLAHLGIGELSVSDNQGVNYINYKLSEAFGASSLISGNDNAVSIMKDLPSPRNDLILGSIAANCGKLAMIGIIICLLVLSVYVFGISLKQKNSLGYIIGCSCGLVIAIQSISNILIAFGLLPMTSSVLPFFTSGMSYMVVDYALLGLILSIYRYKDIREEKTKVTYDFVV